MSAPHVTNNSGNNEWYTPPHLIEAARAVMGGIDLDPASSDKANETVKAERYYTIEDDGLSQTWSGRVWLNPPYGRGVIDAFVKKLWHAYFLLSEEMTEACVLVNNATETGWGQRLLFLAPAVCFLSGRVRFLDEGGKPAKAPLQGQMVIYLGPNVDRFGEVFGELGKVLYAKR